MFSRTLPLLAVVLMLTGCASGMPRTPEPQTPNLSIPQAQLALCPERMADDLPPNADRNAQLVNHVEAGKTYQGCKTPHNSLVRTLCKQQGITINGSDPALMCVRETSSRETKR